MWNKKLIRVVLLLSLAFVMSLPGHLYAQQETKSKSGSFYSAIGFGTPADVYSPGTMGLGLTGVSNFSGLSPSISNPGQWGLNSYTQGNLLLSFDSFRASDNTSEARHSHLGFENFQVIFPVLRNKMGVSVSFTPIMRTDYLRQEGGSFDPFPNLNDDPVNYAITSSGSGGLNRFEIGTGYRIFDNISIGYAFSAHILSLQNNRAPIFSDAQFQAVSYDIDIEGHGFGHRFGIFAFREDIFSNVDQISFGASLSLPVSIDAERSFSTFRTVNNQRELVRFGESPELRDGTVKVPLEFNTGLTYNLNRLSNVVAELQLQNWGDAEYTFNPSQQAYFKDRLKAGIGYQYHPYRADRRGGFFSTFKYSLGASYDTGYLTIRDEDIKTILFNGGIGFTSQRSASSIDISFHYGIRGTDSSNLVKENIWGIKLSLNLAELMFIQQKFQ